MPQHLGAFKPRLYRAESEMALASFRVIILHYPKQKSIDEMMKYKIS